MYPIEKKSIPFDTIHMDATGRLAKKRDRGECVVVVIDAYTRYVTLTCATNKTATGVLRALECVVSLFGTPGQIIGDQDAAFEVEFEFCEFRGICQHCTAPGVGRSNGQIERVMAVVRDGLAIIRSCGTKDWKRGLGSLELAIASGWLH
ncbi:retroelement polyprotein [Danaus plexippus plexippus]|uniref:Retroelement polyprotein n=1 Tax=Danaus plexippus plexippus TaxID=278856 RepID=A0A212F1R1_DANPL|nr:retroelement polyprotein [Danaus plexippus plexippus]